MVLRFLGPICQVFIVTGTNVTNGMLPFRHIKFIYLLIYLDICLCIYLLLFVTNTVVNFFRSLQLFGSGNYDSCRLFFRQYFSHVNRFIKIILELLQRKQNEPKRHTGFPNSRFEESIK